jgi:MFS transporter, OPA family, hexose phosphate transport protein UhpT
MTSLLQFFSSYSSPKINLPIAQQRKIWLAKFLKTFAVVFVVYMVMYFIRNNFKASSGMLKDQLGITTIQLGQIGLAFSITYGIGKTLLGYFADGRNTKRIMSCLLILAALSVTVMGIILAEHNLPMGFLLLLWGLNGLFQSAGGPLSYSTILKWTPRLQRGRWIGIWNISHNIGGAIAGILALWGANLLFAGDVSGMFIFPALIALLVGIVTLFIGHDSPEELGMERVEVLFNESINKDDINAVKLSKWEIFVNYVLTNKWVWLLCISNVFVYIIRIGIDNWAPLYTKEMFAFTPAQQVSTIFYFEMGALVASLIWGYISDLLGGRCALVALFCLLLTSFAVIGYRYGTSPFMINLFLFCLGSLIFGPQLLIGVSVVGFVPKKAVAVTDGITGTFAYLFGDSVAKIVLAIIADPQSLGLTVFGHTLHGWNDTFKIFYCALVCGVILLGIVTYGEEMKIRKSNLLNEHTA